MNSLLQAILLGLFSRSSVQGFLLGGTPNRFALVLSATRRARDLVESLVNEEQCYTTLPGARAFSEVCALNIVYEDRFESQPVVGRSDVQSHMLSKVAHRKGKGSFRIDRISDGDKACGFCWTWTCGEEEGLRGTTFVELNDQGEIQFVAEIPEPLFKPGNGTVDFLKTLMKDEVFPEAVPLVEKSPTEANEIVKYLYVDTQNVSPEDSVKVLQKVFRNDITYYDFNFQEPMRSLDEVFRFLDDFRIPGIQFRPLRFDDGIDSTCFTWEVVLGDIPETVKGISFYELDETTRQVKYVRDIPESAIKPPILGKLARQLRPGLGVFQGVPIGSRSKL